MWINIIETNEVDQLSPPWTIIGEEERMNQLVGGVSVRE